MESKFHVIDEVNFSPNTLRIYLTSLHTGKPDGYIGLPLGVTEQSSHYLVEFEVVGRFQVVNEAFNDFKEPYEKISNFLFRIIDSEYLKAHGNSAKYFLHGTDSKTIIEHYVIYSEAFVVDVLSGTPPTIKLVNNEGD